MALKNFTSPKFWACYHELPAHIQRLADKNFRIFKENPAHPSLDFKKLPGTQLWSARVGDHYRALALKKETGCLWFWIGTHEEYNKLAAKRGT